MTPHSLFRAAAIAEAITWTLLIGGLVLRAIAELDLAVTIGGGIHGFVFLAYAATALIVGLNQRWSIGLLVLAVGAAVVPYATVPLELWLAKSGRLAGTFRLQKTEDPRDAGRIDGALRWLLRHPLQFVVGALLLVALAFVVLLLIGPPGG